MAKTKQKKAPEPDYIMNHAFPTVLIKRDWKRKDKLNDALREGIWRERALDPDGLYRSNVSGTWHSNDALFTSLGVPGAELKEMFGNAFVKWGQQHGLKAENGINLRMAAWAMLYSDRGYATVHTHPNCDVSGVYYVDDTTANQEQIMATGAPVRSGDIEFIDTRTGGQRQSTLLHLNTAMVIPFKRGRMLIFPSALPHFVHPIVGAGERISISCNCTFLPKGNS